MIVDVHNHFFPAEFLAAIAKGPSNFRITEDRDGNPVLHSPGDYNVLVPGHRDIEYRKRVLDEVGIDHQVLTFTAPGTSIETPRRAAELAQHVNDGLRGAVASYPQRFSALAHLPLNNPVAALAELRRAAEDLGFAGAMLFSNASGVALSDDRFLPLYELADDKELVLYIHPTYPVGVEAMEEFMLMPLVGFLMDTTLAAAGLVYGGIPERFPKIRWMLGHLGGAIPYLAERLDRGYEAFRRCREKICRPPSSYLAEFYFDTVNFDPNALRLALEFAGPNRLVAGSDYPHMIGSIDRMVESIRSLGLDSDIETKILGGNALELLRRTE